MKGGVLHFHSDGWSGMVDEGWRDIVGHFDDWLAAHPGQRVVDKPTRRVSRVETDRGTVYVKIVQTLVDGRHFWLDVLKRLKWYLRPSRAVRVKKLTDGMAAAGIPCAAAVLAARRRHLFRLPEDIIITQEIPFPSLLEILAPLSYEGRCAVLQHVADCLFAFHNAGFAHGDCIPENVLWDGAKAYFIDNDRTEPLCGKALLKGRLRNLLQFCYHVELSLQDVRLGAVVLERYNAQASRSMVDVQVMQQEVRRKLVRKIRKYNMANWLEP